MEWNGKRMKFIPSINNISSYFFPPQIGRNEMELSCSTVILLLLLSSAYCHCQKCASLLLFLLASFATASTLPVSNTFFASTLRYIQFQTQMGSILGRNMTLSRSESQFCAEVTYPRCTNG